MTLWTRTMVAGGEAGMDLPWHPNTLDMPVLAGATVPMARRDLFASTGVAGTGGPEPLRRLTRVSDVEIGADGLAAYQQLVVRPGVEFRFKDVNPAARITRDGVPVPDKDLEKLTRELVKENRKAKELLVKAALNALLIQEQGIDATGKDGAAKKALDLGLIGLANYTAFKGPTPEELLQAPFFRELIKLPPRGTYAVFNRTAYEWPITGGARGTFSPDEVRRQLALLRDMETHWAESGVLMSKFYFVVSKQEQGFRLRERMENENEWIECSPGDLETRNKFWKAIHHHAAQAINATATDMAPWYIVPVDHKPTRDFFIASVLAGEIFRPNIARWRAEALRVGRQRRDQMADYAKEQGIKLPKRPEAKK